MFLWFISLIKQRLVDNLLRRDRRVVMPKVKLPSAKPSTKSRLPKKSSLTGARGSPPATGAIIDVNCIDLLNDASEILHRDEDMVSCGLRVVQGLVFLVLHYNVYVCYTILNCILTRRAGFNQLCIFGVGPY